MKKPIKGKEYLCIKTVVMDSGYTAYIKGKVYISEQKGCITNEKNNANHIWTKKGMNECFTEIKETFEITKETIVKYKMKDEFPEVFKKEEQNGWYKDKEYPLWLCFFENDCLIYGFDIDGDYFINKKPVLDTDKKNDIPATEQEVFEALKNEAVKRGFVDNAWVNTIYNTKKKIGGKLYYYHDTNKVSSLNDSDGMKGCLFYKGKWATIIPTKTKEEAEKLLNCKIV